MCISSAMVLTSTPLLELEVGHSAFCPRRHQINEIPILNQRRFFSIHRHQTIYRRPQLRLKIYTQVCSQKISRVFADFVRNVFTQ